MEDGTKAGGKGRMSREQRLATELRENLKRRKAQARARDTTANVEAPLAEVAAPDAPVRPQDGTPEEC